MHDSVPPIPSAKKSTKVPCHRVGFCICEGVGKKQMQVRSKLYSHMKATFKKDSLARSHLHGKGIVVVLSPGVAPALPESPWALAAVEAGVMSESPAVEVKYWHVSHMTFSPYCAAFRPLRHLREEQHGDRCEFHFEVEPNVFNHTPFVP